ncbi:putative gustatory receptor 28b [Fopius arisanus]|uniref:Gustatory receptor 28b n=1 Tax=Fopius arisanus TaxID=64838 RepID=A0A9R1TA25_9HYME|nr:PREDICTED: putative gustatory receptor 28b [Fopius arisanus]
MTFVVITLPNFIFTWLILQYTFVLILLRERFRVLNEALGRISSAAFVKPYYFRSSESTLGDVITRNLCLIKESHDDLYEIACHISSLYSFPIFLVISVFCATIIVSAYYFVLALIPAHRVEPFIIFNSMFYIVMEIFPIIVLSFGVNKITNEMKLTAVAIHKLLTRSSLNAKSKTQLKLFSLELLHKNVSFTGYNIFALDGTLLHSILNTTATYLIILFQFGQSNGKPCHDSID